MADLLAIPAFARVANDRNAPSQEVDHNAKPLTQNTADKLLLQMIPLIVRRPSKASFREQLATGKRDQIIEAEPAFT